MHTYAFNNSCTNDSQNEPHTFRLLLLLAVPLPGLLLRALCDGFFGGRALGPFMPLVLAMDGPRAVYMSVVSGLASSAVSRPPRPPAPARHSWGRSGLAHRVGTPPKVGTSTWGWAVGRRAQKEVKKREHLSVAHFVGVAGPRSQELRCSRAHCARGVSCSVSRLPIG